MNGLRCAALYSLTTNRLGYCGPKSAFSVFENFILNGVGAEKVKALLERFEGVYPYLQVIAEKNNLESFDEQVVDAYWLGNRLLDSMNAEDIKEIINKLSERGLPKIVADKLIARVPKNSIPHHSFNVIFVGVGTVTGSVPANLKNMNSCMVNWGRVVEAGNQLAVETQELCYDNGYFLKPATKRISFNKALLGSIKQGDFVSFHWDNAVEVLSEEHRKGLERYTQKIISAVNYRP